MAVLAALVGVAGVAMVVFWALAAAGVRHSDSELAAVLLAIGSAFATVFTVTLLLIIAFGAQTAARAAVLRPLGPQAFGGAFADVDATSGDPGTGTVAHAMPKVPPRVAGIAKASAGRLVRGRI